MSHRTLVDVPTLLAHLDDPEWVVFDVRHDLARPDEGAAAWALSHVPGSRHLHLDHVLSGPKTGDNGRHPLPDRGTLAGTLGRLGVGPGSQVVAYDAHGGMFAARLWWLLRWLGHDRVAVLDGGLPAWTEHGAPLESVPPASRAPRAFRAAAPLVASVDIDEVLASLGTGGRLIIDARAPDRFRGENETIDPVGGHIPGAVNRFFRENLREDGRFKEAGILLEEYRRLLADRSPAESVMQCGSGVTACHNLLALEIAGLPGAALYPGSWSEWCADPERPVAR